MSVTHPPVTARPPSAFITRPTAGQRAAAAAYAGGAAIRDGFRLGVALLLIGFLGVIARDRGIAEVTANYVTGGAAVLYLGWVAAWAVRDWRDPAAALCERDHLGDEEAGR